MAWANKKNLLKKLMFRELYGEIKVCRSQSCQRLFQQLPQRLAFTLSQLAPVSALAAGHIFLGFTKCGQFLLSYTHTCDTDDHTLQIIHRYRLHWWLFTPYTRLRKVAEVMLFGDQDLQESIYENIYIAVCQWPKDLSKLLVYGCSVDGGESTSGPQTRRVYITVTALPSLDNCSACYQVATSYGDDDLAERWNSCVRFSCLQHGVTVHTSFEMVPPFAQFMPEVQMKMEGHVILNAGNFIHVLSVNFENIQKKKDSNASNLELFNIRAFREKQYNRISEDSENDENSSLKTKLNLQGSLSSKLPPDKYDDHVSDNKLKVSLSNFVDKDREWEILIGSTNKSRVSSKLKNDVNFDSSSSVIPSCDCDIKSIDSDCSSICGDSGKGIIKGHNTVDDSPFDSVDDDVQDSDDSTVCSQSNDDTRSKFRSSTVISLSEASYEMTDDILVDDNSSSPKIPTKQAEKEYEFIDEITEGRHEKLSVFRRRRLAEKKYEFSDENSENFSGNSYRSFRNQSQKIIMSPSRSPKFRNFSVPFSELNIELGENGNFFRSVYEKLLSPSSGSASPNDVLRPISQNITSPILSPRDEKWRDELDKLEKADIQRWSSRESLTLYSPISYSQQRFLDHKVQNGIGKNHQALKCVVDIRRRYIEVDDELVSIITDIEDDELSTATGYHNALPLEVHGSGYSQMHMVSNNKAEKLMAPGILVRQVSLDVEQFCHETAQRLCNEAGKKYYFCNDYNVEIVDVCPTSGNIIALASVLMQAGNKSCIGKPLRGPMGGLCSRKLYKATATFLFNVDTKIYYLLDKEPLVEEDPYSLEVDLGDWGDEHCEGAEWWMKTRIDSQKLRKQWAIPTDYFSRVKVMTNEALLNGRSLTHIIEGYHHIALVLGNNR